MKDKICLMQLTEDELRELIKSSVQELINENKSNQQIKALLTFKEVLSLLCQGNTNVEIAEKLFLSPKTIEGHRANLLSKTGTKNSAHLVMS